MVNMKLLGYFYLGFSIGTILTCIVFVVIQLLIYPIELSQATGNEICSKITNTTATASSDKDGLSLLIEEQKSIKERIRNAKRISTRGKEHAPYKKQ